MIPSAHKKRPLVKRLLIGAGLLLVIGAGIYWYLATEKFADTMDREAAYTVNANAFIKEFETNNKQANQKYSEKIIAVTGIVSQAEAADTTINIKMADITTGSYIIFAFQDQHLNEAKELKAGDIVTIKGSCSGGEYSEILGTHFISFKRSALIKSTQSK